MADPHATPYRVRSLSIMAGALVVLLTLFVVAIAVGQWWAYLMFVVEGGFVNAVCSILAAQWWTE